MVALTSVAPEPFGRVVVEAMLAERPVVATSGGGAAEILAGPAFWSRPAIRALSQAISAMLADTVTTAAMAARGRHAAAARYALPVTLALLEPHVAELAGGAPARTRRGMVARAAAP